MGLFSKDPSDARVEGYRNGREGRCSSAGVTQGWSDTRDAFAARQAGYQQGRADRINAEETRREHDKRDRGR